jgi:hypothetical protein
MACVGVVVLLLIRFRLLRALRSNQLAWWRAGWHGLRVRVRATNHPPARNRKECHETADGDHGNGGIDVVVRLTGADERVVRRGVVRF